jgi:methanogenic corrinoid protein MtbC1
MSDEGPNLPPVDLANVVDATPDAISADTLAGFLVDGDEQLVAWALRIALAGRPRAEVYDTLVRDAMRLVGERWVSGRWSISEEHLASRTLQRALEDVAPEPGSWDRIGPQAVLAGVAGEDHAIGLMLLEHILRETGWSVADLGSDVPSEDLARYAARNECRLVALSATLSERLPAVAETIAAIAALPSRPAIIVGGRLAERGDLVALGAHWAGTSLRAAQAYAAELLSTLPVDSTAE